MLLPNRYIVMQCMPLQHWTNSYRIVCERSCVTVFLMLNFARVCGAHILAARHGQAKFTVLGHIAVVSLQQTLPACEDFAIQQGRFMRMPASPDVCNYSHVKIIIMIRMID
jgi:hypothetical protein